jgi:release factor glutamine methyltransferase
VKISECWADAAEELSGRHIPDARIEAETLLRHALGMTRSEFFAGLGECLTPSQESRMRRLVLRRLEGEPLAYMLGVREFYGLDFAVNRYVLIPRQETELLVDRVLEWCSTRRREERVEIADVGTGCGAIGVAIASNVLRASVSATDVSCMALRVADVNRRRHGVSDRVRLSRGDLLEALDGPVDLIVSNPPYIRSDELAGLATEVRREPAMALDGGEDGLEVTRRLLRQAPSYLKPGGRIFVEIAPEQLGPVSVLARETMPEAQIRFSRDLLGLSRAVAIDPVTLPHDGEASTTSELIPATK